MLHTLLKILVSKSNLLERDLRKTLKLGQKEHTRIVQQIKKQVSLPYIGIVNPYAFPIIRIDALDIGFSAIFKQDFKNLISIRYHFWYME